MTYIVVDAHYTKEHPYSIVLDVCCCPGDNGRSYKLIYPLMEGNLSLDDNQRDALKLGLDKEISKYHKLGERTNRALAKTIKELNLQVSI